MSADLSAIIAKVVLHAPDWLRREMLSDDQKIRRQAEQTFAAMLTGAIASETAAPAPKPERKPTAPAT